MKHRFKVALMLLSIIVVSCDKEPDKAFDEATLAKEIDRRYADFVSSMNSLDVDALKDFYSDDPRFYWVEDGQIQYANKITLTASLSGLVGSLKSTDLKLLRTNVEVFDSNSAMIFAEYEQAMEMQSGFTFDINGAMTVLLQKEEGTWRFLIGHSSAKKQRGG